MPKKKSGRAPYHLSKKAPKRTDDNRKRSPHSLRRVFTAIFNSAGPDGVRLSEDGFLSLFRERWQERGNRYGVVAGEITKRQLFSATDDGDRPLYYWQIEGYSNLVELPSALLLLVSRLTAHKKHVADSTFIPNADSEVDIAGVEAVLELYESTISKKQVIDDVDLISLLKAYKNYIR